jgi:eukaryotic-like serine/threonine-protein kinase
VTPLENIAYSHRSGMIIDGKYRLETLLGEGGMATVWRAQHVVLGTQVAIKLVKPEARLGELTQRLIVEAQVEAQLTHPSIVRVSDFGQTDDGMAFMVMELLQGRSLAEEMARCGAIDPIEAVRLLLPVVDALAFAHEAGIVHRDLKPENIFLAQGDRGVRPKIVDFGIAKLMRGGLEDCRVTQRGTLLGSPAYMAPEQARGEDTVDGRSDVWSIAVVLYEMVTGRPLFAGNNCHAVLRAVVEDEVRPWPVTSEAGLSLWPVLEPALRKQREERYASARELQRALARWLLACGVATDACGTRIDPRAAQPGHDSGRRPLSIERAATVMVARQPAPPPRFDRTSAPELGQLVVPRRGGGARGLAVVVAAAAAVVTLALTGMSPAEWAASEPDPVPEAKPLPVAAPEPAAPAPAAAQAFVDPGPTPVLNPRAEIADALLIGTAPHEPSRPAAGPSAASARPERLGLKDPY